MTVTVEAVDATDAHVLAVLRKRHDGQEVGFEGSYGFAYDVVTHGWRKASHRALDTALSTERFPVPANTLEQPLVPGERVPLEIALLPQATRFRAGDELEVEIRGSWIFPANPLISQFPARYESGPSDSVVLLLGPDNPSHITLPIRRVL